MHIGLITADLHHQHGWGHYSLGLIEALRARGVRVTVVAARNSPTNYAFPVYPMLPTISPAEAGQLVKLAGLVPSVRGLLRDADVLHCTVEPYAPLAMWVAGGRPYVVTAHGTYARAGWNRGPLVRPVHQRSFRQAARVVCVSHYTARVAREYTPGIRTTTVTHAIDSARFADPHPLPDAPARPIVLTAGGVKRRKGTPQLVRALAQVREQVPDVLGVIVGNTAHEPDTTAEVRRLIDAHDLTDHVLLTGFVDEATLMGWYGAADVFALPSVNDGYKFEGFGLVHLEASAAGLPVVGADNCGAEDAILHGVTGLLVSQANLDAELAPALVSLLADPARAAQMGAAGRAHAQRQTWAAKADELLAVYRAVGG